MTAWYFDKNNKQKELIECIECSAVLVECEELAVVSRSVCRAAEAPKLESEQHPRVPWPRYSTKLIFQLSRPFPFLY